MVRFERPAIQPVGWPEVWGGMGVFLLFVARFIPIAKLPFWGCALRQLTGIPCLACGMTRSFDWFMHGRFLDSFLVNPMGFGLALSAVIGFVYLVLRPLRLPRLYFDFTERESLIVRILAIVLIFANWGYLITWTLIHRA